MKKGHTIQILCAGGCKIIVHLLKTLTSTPFAKQKALPGCLPNRKSMSC